MAEKATAGAERVVLRLLRCLRGTPVKVSPSARRAREEAGERASGWEGV